MISFNKFALELEGLSQHRSRNKIVEFLGQFFEIMDAQEAQCAAYLVLGTLGPTYAPIRFNLADKQVFSFLQVFVTEAFGVDAANYFLEKFEQVGDLGDAFFCVSSEFKVSAALNNQKDDSFLIIFNLLRELALCSGAGSVQRKRDMLFELLQCVSFVGQKYLIKIIVGQLRLGFSVNTLLEAFTFMMAKELSFGPKSIEYKNLKKLLEDNYYVCADVGLLICKLKEVGAFSLTNPLPTIGIPVCPAAAERVADLSELLERQRDFIAQPKLDGLRVQVHKTNSEVRLFSRNLLDISDMLPEIILAFHKLPPTNFIVEGEVLGYDSSRNTDVGFQMTSKRRRKHDISAMAEACPVRVYLFDILVFDNISCLSRPYILRREILERAFPEETPPLSVVPQEEFTSGQGTEREILEVRECVKNYFTSCVARGYEGIVAKKQQGTYESGKRGFNWIKIKHLADCKLKDTVDAVIIGFFNGKGRRAEFGLGALLVALYNTESQSFQTVAKVGTGLADAELITFWHELQGLRLASKPDNYDVSKSFNPDGWVMAKLVIEVEADDITISKAHTAGWGKVVENRGLALRFPCLKKRCLDKSIEQVTTTDELVRLVLLRKVITE